MHFQKANSTVPLTEHCASRTGSRATVTILSLYEFPICAHIDGEIIKSAADENTQKSSVPVFVLLKTAAIPLKKAFEKASTPVGRPQINDTNLLQTDDLQSPYK
jgi:hypothetical protein